MSGDQPTTRRTVLKLAGGSLGGLAGVVGLSGTGAAADAFLQCDWVLHDECPTTTPAEGPTAEKETPLYEACTDDFGNQCYFVCEDGYEEECDAFGDEYDFMVVGYAPSQATEPC